MLTLSLHSFLSAHRVNSSCQAQGARSKAEAQNSHRNRHNLAVQIFWRHLVIIALQPSTVAGTVTQWQGVQRHPDPSSGTHTASYQLLNLLSPGWRVISSVQIQNNGRCTGDRDQGKTRGQHLAHPICRGRGSARARATCSNTSHNHISWIISTLQLQWWREVVRYV